MVVKKSEILPWMKREGEVGAYLEQLAHHYGRTEKAEKILEEALKKYPEDLDLLSAAYRFYFYKHRYAEALGAVERVLELTRSSLALPEEREQRLSFIQRDPENPEVRFFVNATAATGYLLAREGRREEAEPLLRFVKDAGLPQDFGAGMVLDLMGRPPEEEEEEEE